MRRTNAVVRKSIKRSIKPVPVGWSKSRQVLMRWWQQRCPERRRPRRLHGDIASNYSLCHKTTGHVQPTQALLWIIGDIDSHNLNNAQPYGAWTSVLEDLENEKEYLGPPAEPISDENPYPFTYDGSLLVILSLWYSGQIESLLINEYRLTSTAASLP
ncbi:hypothetical protein V8E54_011586 [Elaphomyces granulatus]